MTVTAPAAGAQTSVAKRTREATGGGPRRATVFADFHIHTRHSPDSLMSEDRFIRTAIERGLTHVAVTNHNNVEGAIAVRDRAEELGLAQQLRVILGEEVSTADGEVVGVFLQRTIPRDLSADETADAIHEQGGLVSVPHPFDPFRRSHIRPEPLEQLAQAGKIDMLEVFNSRVTFQRHNQQAAEFAARFGIPGIACSDSHSPIEVAMSFNAMPEFSGADELRAGLAENEWHGNRSTFLIHLTTRWAVLRNSLRGRSEDGPRPEHAADTASDE